MHASLKSEKLEHTDNTSRTSYVSKSNTSELFEQTPSSKFKS